MNLVLQSFDEIKGMTRKWISSIFATAIVLASQAVADSPFSPKNSLLNSLPAKTTTTVPATNGDLNPYGVAFVPEDFPSGGTIGPGDVLVANFNDNSNVQGTGTTIVSISPHGQQTLFATSSAIGLDTALGVLSAGLVVVGNLPVTSSGPGQGSLQFFDRNGGLVAALTDAKLLNGPWDLTINDKGSTAQIFVTNALSGTVTRVTVAVNSSSVKVLSMVQIGSGFVNMLNSSVVVLAPTGLAYDAHRDMLFVASTGDNEIFGIQQAGGRTTDAGTGAVVYADPANLHGPLGLTLLPNGHLIAANGDAVNATGTQNELVEFTEQGHLVASYQLDPGAPGAAFGVAAASSHGTVRFAAVDDDLNAVIVWTLHAPLEGDE